MDTSSTRFVPKYWQLVEQFRKQIEIGILKPGDRLPSYTEMRSQFGVSRPTTEKLHQILERDGFIVREPGRGTFVTLPKATEKRAAIAFAGLSRSANRHPYGVHILEGVHEVTDREKVDLLLLGDQSSVAWEKVDGILICETEPDVWLRKVPPGMPAVVLLVPSTQVSSVTTGDRQGAFDATDYLISLGHRKIAYLTSAIDPLSILRIQGYQTALQTAGVDFDPHWMRKLPMMGPERDRSFLDRGLETMRAWLADDWKELGCTALLAQNDDTAMGAIQAFQEAGIKVPQEVSVVGFDGTELSQFFSPRLTTMEVPLSEISRIGAELLLRQIQNQGAGQGRETVALPPKTHHS